jgi:excisionase family DNA binding protein
VTTKPKRRRSRDPSGLTLSALEVADMLGVSEWSIYEGVRRGEIPSVGPGKSVRIPTRWVNERLGQGHAGGITLGPDKVAELLGVTIAVSQASSRLVLAIGSILEGLPPHGSFDTASSSGGPRPE